MAKNSSGNFDGYITADSAISSCCPINKLATNQLSSAKCIMYVGCGTGVSYKVGNTSYNLVSATYKKGAHFVLGTEDEVKTAKASEWINDFSYKASKSGSTIADCLSYANYYIGNIPVCTAGDKNCRLNY